LCNHYNFMTARATAIPIDATQTVQVLVLAQHLGLESVQARRQAARDPRSSPIQSSSAGEASALRSPRLAEQLLRERWFVQRRFASGLADRPE
jgi:hypothetical protein